MTTYRIRTIGNTFCTILLSTFLCASSGISICAAPVQGHRIKGLAFLSGQPVGLTLAGSPPAAFEKYFDLFPLEASENLVAWNPLATVVRTNVTNEAIYVDTAVVGQSARFYRTPTAQFSSPFLAPTGPFTVGTLSKTLTDSARTNRFGIRTNSSFVVTFWYPAHATAGDVPARYSDRVLAERKAFWGLYTNLIPAFVSSGRANASLSLTPNRFPLIVYSHGLGDMEGRGVRTENTEKALELASYGYVVVSMDHTDTYEPCWIRST